MKGNSIELILTIYIFSFLLMTPVYAAQQDARVAKALKEAGLNYVVTGLKNYKVEFAPPDERGHVVYVASQTVQFQNMEVRKVWGVAYRTKNKDLPKELANRLLRLNVQSRLGAWEYSMNKDFNRLKYVVRVPANCSGAELKSAIYAAFIVADEMEKNLTKKDEF